MIRPANNMPTSQAKYDCDSITTEQKFYFDLIPAKTTNKDKSIVPHPQIVN